MAANDRRERKYFSRSSTRSVAVARARAKDRLRGPLNLFARIRRRAFFSVPVYATIDITVGGSSASLNDQLGEELRAKFKRSRKITITARLSNGPSLKRSRI